MENQIKYALIHAHKENKKYNSAWDFADNNVAEILKVFDNVENAIDELKKEEYKSSVRYTKAHTYFYIADVYYVAEVELYNEEGDWDDFDDLGILDEIEINELPPMNEINFY